MRAGELMIGDWVNIMVEGYDNPTQIEEIGHFWVKVTQDEKDYGIVLIEPIPITQEILERNGFKKEYERTWVLREKGKQPFVIEYLAGYWCPSYGKEAIAALKYIHELQHAFKLMDNKNIIEL